MIKKLLKWVGIIPESRPDIDPGLVHRLAAEAGVNLDKEVCIINLRGFYSPGNNKRGKYDDAAALYTPTGITTFNINTDPSAFKFGIATLCVGTWLYKIGIHGLNKPKILQYKALVQAAMVTVTRDGKGKDTGFFGINYHKGGTNGTSSLGCQTVAPGQWAEFIGTVEREMKKYNQKTIKVIVREILDEE